MRIEKRMRSGVLIILAYLLAVMVGVGAGGDGAAQPEVIIKTGGSVTAAVPRAAQSPSGEAQSETAPPLIEKLPVAPVIKEAPDPVVPVTNSVPDGGKAPAAETGSEDQDAAVDEQEDAYNNMELMAEVIMHIRKHYVAEKTFKEITYGALHGMLQAMDPHSDFLEPSAYEGLKENTRGSFSGIGIHIGMRNGFLSVIAPIEDSPAFHAGLISGDRIIEINDEPTSDMSLRDAVNLLRGEAGTAVTVKVLRDGEDDALEISIVRDDIELSSVKGVRLLAEGIGYVRITQFAEPTAELLQAAIEELLDQGMQALVIDLRSNPGGLLRSAVGVAEKFIKEDDVVVSTRGRAHSGQESVKRAKGALHYTDLDIAILVNGGSASASEIVAGCLQDHRRAILVGERTFGKGSVQSVIRLESAEDAAIRLTTAYYYTPAGRMIHNKGIEPDISIPVTPSEWRRVVIKRIQDETPDIYSKEEKAPYADVKDQVLQRAVDMLKGILIFEQRD